MMMTLTATAAPILDTGNPLGFFTNVASRLLAEELNVNLTRIQIYPTNQYTPAVHRLLQVAANLYDATTNRYYDPVPDTNTIPLPTVFRPFFVKEGTNVYIAGYSEVTNVSEPDLPLSRPYNLADPNELAQLIQGTNYINVYGVPMIVGAKKGLPNFNEFALQSGFQLMRKLQVTRSSPNDLPNTYQLNQMFGLAVSNQLGVECWNSYSSDSTRPVNIFVTDYLTMTLTNDEGLVVENAFVLSGANSLITAWPGYNPAYPIVSFQIPLNTSAASMPFSIYHFNEGNPYLTTNLTLPFETGVIINGLACPQPNWGMSVANNLQVAMVDAISGRIIDYVQLSGPNSTRNLSAEIQREYDVGNLNGYNGLWVTNLSNQGLPRGIGYQVGVALGSYGFSSAFPQTIANENAIDGFRAFYHVGPMYNNPGEAQIIAAAQTNLAMLAAFIPIATSYQHTTWQANDPLVHYLASDLNISTGNGIDSNNLWPGNLGVLNIRYTPWGGNPYIPYADKNPYNLALKDPQVRSSDNWNFPSGQPLNAGWIGQVHRGTPWQTIYLKATDIGLNIWTNWTGDFDTNDAAAMTPVHDWHVASLLTAWLNTNNLASEFSVNNPNPNAWQGLLDGLIALTNIPGQPEAVLISSNSPQASVIASAIQSARATQPGHRFSDIGDILAAPQLAEQSPFLTGLNPTNGISDEAYEVIPGQLLALLRADSIGSAAWLNGQSLMQFTGYDGHSYAIQASADLVNWASVSTNGPVNGVFSFTNSAVPKVNQQFYRSVLLQ